MGKVVQGYLQTVKGRATCTYYKGHAWLSQHGLVGAECTPYVLKESIPGVVLSQTF
jgi:hypothetical protein